MKWCTLISLYRPFCWKELLSECNFVKSISNGKKSSFNTLIQICNFRYVNIVETKKGLGDPFHVISFSTHQKNQIIWKHYQYSVSVYILGSSVNFSVF